MKIGIVTHPLHTNYGGVIQNYALQKVLINIGHAPITLREKLDLPMWHWGKAKCFYNYCISVVKYVVKKILRRDVPFPLTQKRMLKLMQENQAIIEEFITPNILTTEAKSILDVADVKEMQLGAIIVGSDQVWRPSYVSHLMENQLLGFTGDYPIVRISYAASFGIDEWAFSEEETAKSLTLISKFNAISVREKSGVDLCKKYWNVDAAWVVDPTMLLYKDDYLALCREEPVSSERFVFAYILSKNTDVVKKVNTLAKQKGCQVKFLDVDLTSQKDSVGKWLSYFRDAEYIITDSFHGTVFSIMFQKEFLCVYNKGRGKSRFESLNEIVKLDDRFTDKLSVFPDNIIDYKKVEERLNEKRQESFSFLRKHLKE